MAKHYPGPVNVVMEQLFPLRASKNGKQRTEHTATVIWRFIMPGELVELPDDRNIRQTNIYESQYILLSFYFVFHLRFLKSFLNMLMVD